MTAGVTTLASAGAVDGAGAGAVPFVVAGGKMVDPGVSGSARGPRRLFQTQYLAPPLAGLFVPNGFLE
jgi:hypothetical protein